MDNDPIKEKMYRLAIEQMAANGMKPPKESVRVVENAIAMILQMFVNDWTENPNFQETPQRVARAMFDTWFNGYNRSLEDEMKTFPNTSHETAMVVVKDIPFYSTCAHHMSPFFGKAAIAYIPHERVAGLSKFARAIDIFARRLQLQEHITKDVARGLNQLLDPRGLMVVLYDVEHTCMTNRGVQAHGSTTSTSIYFGCFEDLAVRQEALTLIFGR